MKSHDHKIPNRQVDHVLQKDGPAKALLNAGEVFAVQNHRSARITRIHNKVYVHHLKDARPPASAHTIPVSSLTVRINVYYYHHGQ